MKTIIGYKIKPELKDYMIVLQDRIKNQSDFNKPLSDRFLEDLETMGIKNQLCQPIFDPLEERAVEYVRSCGFPNFSLDLHPEDLQDTNALSHYNSFMQGYKSALDNYNITP